MVPVRQPEFANGDSGDFVIDGIPFKVIVGGGDYDSRKTDREGVVLLKGWNFIASELKELGEFKLERMIEFGLWRGGSAVLWPLTVSLERYVGIDLQPKKFEFPEAVLTHKEFKKVRLFWETSQDDRDAVLRIIDTELGGQLDLVVDDASHQYQLSKSTFEICFPRLRPGGIYLLEDWSWSHAPGYQGDSAIWADRPALTNLVFDLTAVLPSQPGLVRSIKVYPSFVLIERGASKVGPDFRVDDLVVKRPYDRLDWIWATREKKGPEKKGPPFS